MNTSKKPQSKKPQCSDEQLLEIKEAFNVFDSEQSGGLDPVLCYPRLEV